VINDVLYLSEVKKTGLTKFNHITNNLLYIKYNVHEIYKGKYILVNDSNTKMIVAESPEMMVYSSPVDGSWEMPNIFANIRSDYYYLYKRNNDVLKLILFYKEEYRG
jgi:hypothetical protein